MTDCEVIDKNIPIRQGDIIKSLSKEVTEIGRIYIVLTADCDIAQNKTGEAGLVCANITTLKNYLLENVAEKRAKERLNKRVITIASAINKIWTSIDLQNAPISPDRVFDWLAKSEPEAIEAALKLPFNYKNGWIQFEKVTTTKASALLNTKNNPFKGIDALATLEQKQGAPAIKRDDQIQSFLANFSPSNLPLDVFFISSIPGEIEVGFIVKLRELYFISPHLAFTNMTDAKEHDNSHVRLGRLGSTFRHAAAQQFGNLFARIGLPKRYEEDRDAVFSIVEDILIKEAQKNEGNCN